MDADANESFRPFDWPSTLHDPYSLIDFWCSEDEFDFETSDVYARTGSGEDLMPELIRDVLKRWFDEARPGDIAAILGKLTHS